MLIWSALFSSCKANMATQLVFDPQMLCGLGSYLKGNPSEFIISESSDLGEGNRDSESSSLQGLSYA